LILGLVVLPSLLVGCAAITNPVADGIPVRYLPPEAFGESKDNFKQIQEAYLRQAPPAVYLLAKGDVLGIWVAGVPGLGDKDTPPPVRFSEQGNRAPSIGFPFPVREDGTLALPSIDPIKVSGMSIEEAQAAIVKAYTVTNKIIQPGKERVIVTLMQPRHYHILVLREDAGTASIGSTGGFGGLNSGTFFSETRKSTGTSLDLPAYENDVLNALTRTGGLPGFEAEDDVIIQRGAAQKSQGQGQESCPPAKPAEQSPSADGSPSSESSSAKNQPLQTIRIPLRLRVGEKPSFPPSDVILQDGDIVNVRLRKGEFFYTGGLLPPRLFPLPKNRDLDIVEALVIVGAPLINGGIGVNNLSGSLSASGLGSSSPSLITVLRRTAAGTQIPIRVSLNQAFRDPRERILVMPGDVIILQATMLEAVANYVTSIWRFNFFGTIIKQTDLTGTSTMNVP